MVKLDDFIVAIEFFRASENGIVIQVPKAELVPHVRQLVARYVGVPSAIYAHGFRYDKRFINIVVTDEESYKTELLFYVGYDDEHDLYWWEVAEDQEYIVQ